MTRKSKETGNEKNRAANPREEKTAPVSNEETIPVYHGKMVRIKDRSAPSDIIAAVIWKHGKLRAQVSKRLKGADLKAVCNVIDLKESALQRDGELPIKVCVLDSAFGWTDVDMTGTEFDN